MLLRTCAACSPPDLDKFLLLQIPLLDAVVPGATEEDVSLDSQALDAVIVRGLKVVSGANVAHHALSNLKHLGRKTVGERLQMALETKVTLSWRTWPSSSVF